MANLSRLELDVGKPTRRIITTILLPDWLGCLEEIRNRGAVKQVSKYTLKIWRHARLTQAQRQP